MDTALKDFYIKKPADVLVFSVAFTKILFFESYHLPPNVLKARQNHNP